MEDIETAEHHTQELVCHSSMSPEDTVLQAMWTDDGGQAQNVSEGTVLGAGLQAHSCDILVRIRLSSALVLRTCLRVDYRVMSRRGTGL